MVFLLNAARVGNRTLAGSWKVAQEGRSDAVIVTLDEVKNAVFYLMTWRGFSIQKNDSGDLTIQCHGNYLTVKESLTCTYSTFMFCPNMKFYESSKVGKSESHVVSKPCRVRPWESLVLRLFGGKESHKSAPITTYTTE